MRRSLFGLFLVFSLVSFAQRTPIEKYNIGPDDYQEIFLDMIEKHPLTIITTTTGQYIGQVGANEKLYGYGMFVNNDGSQITGMFREGKPFLTINMSGKNITVGGPDFYAIYGMETGRLDYVYDNKQGRLIPGDELPDRYDYAFVSMRYLNGDQYVGETYQNKRHGYGVYYYASGKIWFGMYDNDIRSGYGCLFDEENNLSVGRWDGDVERRLIKIKEKKK